MKKIVFIFSFLAIHFFNTSAQKNTDLFSLKILDHNNHQYNFSEIKKYNACVFIFLLTDCPASQNYTLTIRKLKEKYKSKNVNFIIVFPGDFSTPKDVNDFINQYKLKGTILADKSFALAKFLHAKVAPESFLVSNTGKTLYSGRIDNLYYSPGRKRQVITSNDLDNAIANIVNGKLQTIPSTNAIGCIINY